MSRVRDGPAGPHAHVSRAASAPQPRDGLASTAIDRNWSTGKDAIIATQVGDKIAPEKGNRRESILPFNLLLIVYV